jgi:hypothetical protein
LLQVSPVSPVFAVLSSARYIGSRGSLKLATCQLQVHGGCSNALNSDKCDIVFSNTTYVSLRRAFIISSAVHFDFN